MKRSYTIFVLLAISGVIAAAVDNPATRPPGGSATSVPSAGRNSLIPNPRSSTNYSSNDVVTGNVGGGRHFRGSVPYSSSYYVQGSSSSSVDDFLRRSASPRSAITGSYQPYYDPRLAVGTQVRQQASGRSMVNPYTPANLPQTNNTPFSLQPRPISSRQNDLSVVLKQQMRKGMLDDKTKITGDLNLMAEEASRKLDPELAALQKEMQRDKPQPGQELNENRYLTIRDQILEELKKEQQEAEQIKKEDTDKTESKQDAGKGAAEPEQAKLDGSGLLKEHKTFANLAQAKAENYIDTGMQMIKQGKYYKAADSFSMAAIWQPDNGLVYAGQSWALFNAGEFMSSAYYLGRAITLNPKLAERKIDLSMLTADRDVYENRLLEVSEWQKRSNSGELAFLMAYFYWQDGKMSQAQESIQTALTLMPEEPAVKIFAGVINGQTKTEQTPAVP
ncbi:MAG: tetratricopeptide repeat protein [Sedimentisphaerales bacterium]|nr:tetratricopeptide repeat protein [Sedimentisphaerales bacterium]